MSWLAVLVCLLGSPQAGVPVVAPHLTIRVLDWNLKPLPGVTVRLMPFGRPSEEVKASAVTDAHGEAAIRQVSLGRYEAVCSLAGLLDSRFGPFDLGWPGPPPNLRATVVMNYDWSQPDSIRNGVSLSKWYY